MSESSSRTNQWICPPGPKTKDLPDLEAATQRVAAHMKQNEAIHDA